MVKSEQDLIKLINKFPGISYTEIYKTWSNKSRTSLSNLLLQMLESKKIFRIHDSLAYSGNRNSSRYNKSFYFDISLLDSVVQ